MYITAVQREHVLVLESDHPKDCEKKQVITPKTAGTSYLPQTELSTRDLHEIRCRHELSTANRVIYRKPSYLPVIYRKPSYLPVSLMFTVVYT